MGFPVYISACSLPSLSLEHLFVQILFTVTISVQGGLWKTNPVWDHTDLMSQTPAHLFTHGGQQGFNIDNRGPLFPESIPDLLHLLGILDGWIVADVLSWVPVKILYQASLLYQVSRRRCKTNFLMVKVSSLPSKRLTGKKLKSEQKQISKMKLHKHWKCFQYARIFW